VGTDQSARVSAQIAVAKHAPLRVVAGPGTGKTYSLMAGVTQLLSNAVTAARILVSTFTRTAAADLKREIAKITFFGARDIVAGTLHSFCFSVLSREGVFPVTGRVPRPLLDYELPFLVADLRDKSFGGLRDREKRLRAFGAAWARLQHEKPGWASDAVDRKFDTELNSWLRFHEGMLIEELVPIALRYFRQNPAAPELTAFDHVLVDEYQDLNKAEQVLLDTLAEHGSLTVIGDEDQSIYSFKYAHPEGIREFPATHAGTILETLELCRRCPKRVIELANNLIGVNASRSKRLLKPPATCDDGEVLIVQWLNMEQESRGLARFIKQRIDKGAKPGEILVLAPRRQFGYAIRNELVRLGVIAHSFFSEQSLDGNPRDSAACESQETHALLTVLARPQDRVSLRCFCGFGDPSLESAGWRRIRAHAEKAGTHPRDVLDALVDGSLRLAYVDGIVKRYVELKRRETELGGLRGSALADALFPATKEWADPFRGWAATITDPNYTAADLSDVLTTAIARPELPTDVEYVRVMSLHKSKGLTAQLVVIVGCIEGLIPSFDSTLRGAEIARHLEEQRRVMYVAITRSRTTLVISSIRQMRRDLAHKIGARLVYGPGSVGPAITSRFVNDLGSTAPASRRGSETWPE
jgi:superfamily I DNA/RNA helicase